MCFFNQGNDNSHYLTFFIHLKGKESQDRIKIKTAKNILLFIVKPLLIYTLTKTALVQ